MALFSQGWYVLYTKTAHEKKIVLQLNKKSIQCYLPLVKALRKRGDKQTFLELPLFPSYVFVYLQDLQHYYTCLDQEGVFNYVRIGRDIARVQDNVMDNIRLSVSGGEDVEVSYEHFKPGEQLVIKEGPLTGLSCEVINYNGRNRYMVRVTLMNRCILLTAAASNLLLINSTQLTPA